MAGFEDFRNDSTKCLDDRRLGAALAHEVVFMDGEKPDVVAGFETAVDIILQGARELGDDMSADDYRPADLQRAALIAELLGRIMERSGQVTTT